MSAIMIIHLLYEVDEGKTFKQSSLAQQEAAGSHLRRSYLFAVFFHYSGRPFLCQRVSSIYIIAGSSISIDLAGGKLAN